MTKRIVTVALFIVLATIPVGCKKENIAMTPSAFSEGCTIRIVRYSVDGVTHFIKLNGYDEWVSFLERIVSLAEDGHSVNMTNMSISLVPLATKDTQVFTTTDKNEAVAWINEKGEEGYTVDVTFENGMYICVAYKKDE